MRVVFILLAFAIGLYPIIYFTADRKFGLLSTKTDVLLADVLWNTGFYAHIIGGGLALLVGWIQFQASVRNKHLMLHRGIGKAYVLLSLISAVAGIYIGFFATGGVIASLGFISLGLIWGFTTLEAYRAIRMRRIERHRRMMTYSYAACFAAVTLRLWLPLLTILFGDFIPAYQTVAWLCWVPNLIVARILLRHSERLPLSDR